jgi:hypothetical protein
MEQRTSRSASDASRGQAPTTTNERRLDYSETVAFGTAEPSTPRCASHESESSVLVQRVYTTQSAGNIAKSIHPNGSYKLGGLAQRGVFGLQVGAYMFTTKIDGRLYRTRPRARQLLSSDYPRFTANFTIGQSATQGSTCLAGTEGLHAVEVNHDGGGNDEQQHIVDIEHHLIPCGRWPGHELSDYVLHDQHQPD